MQRRTHTITALAALLVAIVGGAAMAANLGLLSDDTSRVGTLEIGYGSSGSPSVEGGGGSDSGLSLAARSTSSTVPGSEGTVRRPKAEFDSDRPLLTIVLETPPNGEPIKVQVPSTTVVPRTTAAPTTSSPPPPSATSTTGSSPESSAAPIGDGGLGSMGEIKQWWLSGADNDWWQQVDGADEWFREGQPADDGDGSSRRRRWSEDD